MLKSVLKEKRQPKTFSHYVVTPILMENLLKSHSPQNISGASQLEEDAKKN